MGLILRAATPDDADAAARLILEPAGGLTRILPPGYALRAARAAFLAERTALSFARATVAIRDDAVVGQLIRFAGSEWPSRRIRTGLVMLRATGARHALRLVVDGRREERLIPPIAADDLYVMSVAVAPAERSARIGAALMAGAAAEARQRGLRGISLDVAAANEGAIRFYRRAGFAAVETRRVPSDARPPLASVRMRRSLTGS